MRIKVLATLGMIGFTIVLMGCSAFRSSTQRINISCSEQDAILTVNGQRYAPPAQIDVKRNRDVSIQAYKKGFVPSQRTIGNHFNVTGRPDAVVEEKVDGSCLDMDQPER